MTFLTKQAGAVSCLAITVSGLAVGVLAAPADAAPGDGTITVAVSRDFSGDGRYDADVDQPQAGIEVSVSDAAGTIVSGTTDANGEFVVTPSAGLSGGRYLLETAVPSTLDHLQLAPATAATGPNAYRSATTFVDVGDGIDQTVRVGVWNPSDYLPLDPDYILAVQPSRSSSDGSRTLVRSNWVNRGDGNGNGTNPNTLDITTLATKGQTGSLFGVAWAGPGDRVFSAAYAKAMVPYGPGGAGGVYVTNADAGTPNASLYVTIPNTSRPRRTATIRSSRRPEPSRSVALPSPTTAARSMSSTWPTSGSTRSTRAGRPARSRTPTRSPTPAARVANGVRVP